MRNREIATNTTLPRGRGTSPIIYGSRSSASSGCGDDAVAIVAIVACISGRDIGLMLLLLPRRPRAG